MTIAEFALAISFLSIGISIWSAVATRRANQFKRLSELRSKATNLTWQMHYRLSDVKKASQIAGLLEEGAKGNWNKLVADLERLLKEAKEREEFFSSVYSSRKWVPLVIPESIIEEWHHHVDSIATSVDISRKEIAPELQKNAELMSQLLEQQKQLVAELNSCGVEMLENKNA